MTIYRRHAFGIHVAFILAIVAGAWLATNQSVLASSGPWSYKATGEHTWSSDEWKYEQSWVYRHHTTVDLEMQKVTMKSTNLSSSSELASGTFELYYGSTELDYWNFNDAYDPSQTKWTDYVRNIVYDKEPYGGVLSITVSCSCGPPPENVWEMLAETGDSATTISTWHN